MSARLRFNNYLHLALQATFFFLTLNLIRTSLHEIGHGLGAWLFGSRFFGFYFFVEMSRATLFITNICVLSSHQ